MNNLFDSSAQILSVAMQYPEQVPKIIREVKPEWFDHPFNAEIFNAIVALEKKRQSTDKASVSIYLRKSVEKDHVKAGYINDLTEAFCSDVGIDLAIEDLRKSGIKRVITAEVFKVIEAEKTAHGMQGALIEWASGLLPDRESAKIYSMDQASQKFEENFIDRMLSGNSNGLKSGLNCIDKNMGGFYKSELIVIAGRPSMGKTAFAASLVDNIAENGYSPLHISFEMSVDCHMQRAVASESKVSAIKIRTGELNAAHQSLVLDSLKVLKKKKGYLTDSISRDLGTMIEQVKNWRKNHRVDILIIDHLQLIRIKGISPKDRYALVTEITGRLKELAVELDIPILLLSQLNRDVTDRNPPIPNMSDLKDSGSIEQDADSVVLIYRPAFYGLSEEDTTDIIIDKNRHGPTGTHTIYFQPHTMRFYDLERNVKEN